MPNAEAITVLEGLCPSASESATEGRAENTSAPVICRWAVDAIRPNEHNLELFPDSLSSGSIAILAEDLREHGQEQPVQITPAGVLINGERRWRAARQLLWKELDVVITPMADEEILNRILSICGGSRQMSLREKVNVYSALLERLKLASGRPQGRPAGKTIPSGNVFESPKAIKRTAATRAKFANSTEAERALAVFTRGSPDVQAKVTAGKMTLTAAYTELPKRPKAKNGVAGREGPSAGEAVDAPADSAASAPAIEGDAGGAAPKEESVAVEARLPDGKRLDDGRDGDRTGAIAMTPRAVADVGCPSAEEEESLEQAVQSLPQEPDPRRATGGAKGPPPSPSATSEPPARPAPAGQSEAEATRSRRKASLPGREPSRPAHHDSNVVDNPFDVQAAAARPQQSRPAATAAFTRVLDLIDDYVGALCQDDYDEAVKARDVVIARLDATIATWAPARATTLAQRDRVSNGKPAPQDDATAESQAEDDASDDEGLVESETTSIRRKVAIRMKATQTVGTPTTSPPKMPLTRGKSRSTTSKPRAI